MSRRLGTYMMLVLSALLIVVGLKLVIDNWTVGVARQSFFPGISGVSQAGDAEADDWQLLLVNQWNSLPDGYAPELTELWNGESVDSRIYPDLQEMFDDARAVGLNPYVNSGYRTAQVQQSLMDEEMIIWSRATPKPRPAGWLNSGWPCRERASTSLDWQWISVWKIRPPRRHRICGSG